MSGSADVHVGVPVKPEAMTNTPGSNKFWHSRGYLPHCDILGLIQFIIFRLHDSLPSAVVYRLMQEETDDVARLKALEGFLDAGYGACWLKQAELADIVEAGLLYGDGKRYRLLAWCIMPNHVHVLIEMPEGQTLPKVVQGWKSYSARLINQRLGRSGMLWMREYFDRYIRDDHHLAAVIAYIRSNPVKAGLVSNEQDWPYSSASLAGCGNAD